MHGGSHGGQDSGKYAGGAGGVEARLASRVGGAPGEFISSLMQSRAEGARRMSSMVPELRRELRGLLRATEMRERRNLRARAGAGRRAGTPLTQEAATARPWSESQADVAARPRPTTRSSGRDTAPGKVSAGRKVLPRPIGQVRHVPNGRQRWSINVSYAHGGRELLTRTARELGWGVVREPDEWSNLYWTMSNVEVRNLELAGIGPGCVVNRLIGATAALSKKVPLSQLFHILQGMMPDGRYKFYPRAWFTDEGGLEQLRSDVPEHAPLICKPDSGSQGKGIWLATGPDEVEKGIREDNLRRIRRSKPLEEYIVQEYIDRPLLLDGRKFDLRIYVLVLDVGGELRAFISREGMARFCNDKYEPLCKRPGDDLGREGMSLKGFDLSSWDPDNNSDEMRLEQARAKRGQALYGDGPRPLSRTSLPASQESREQRRKETSHLTNTSLNKKQAGWQNGGNIFSDNAGGKRTLSAVLSRLNIDGIIAEGEFWEKLHTLVRHTLQGIRSSLRFEEFATYSKASTFRGADDGGHADGNGDGGPRGLPGTFQHRFQLLGLDVILDESSELHLLEINSNPSLSLDAVYNLVHKTDSKASTCTTAGTLLPPSLSMTKEAGILQMGANKQRGAGLLNQVDQALDGAWVRYGGGLRRPAPEPEYLPVDAQRIMQDNKIPWMGDESVCRCKASALPHVHLPGPIDEHIKIQSMQGALQIVQRAVDFESGRVGRTQQEVERVVNGICHGLDYEEVRNLTPDPYDYSSESRHLNTLDTVSYMLRAAIDSRGRLSCSSLLRLLHAVGVPIDPSTIDIFFQKHFCGSRVHIYASSVTFIQWLHCVLDAAQILAGNARRGNKRGRGAAHAVPPEDTANARELSTKRLLSHRDPFGRSTIRRHKTRPSFLDGASRDLEVICLRFLESPLAQQLGVPGTKRHSTPRTPPSGACSEDDDDDDDRDDDDD